MKTEKIVFGVIVTVYCVTLGFLLVSLCSCSFKVEAGWQGKTAIDNKTYTPQSQVVGYQEVESKNKLRY